MISQENEQRLCYPYYMDEFRERLKYLRMEKEKTQKQVAQETGFAQSAIAFWETGKRVPNAIAIIVLAQYFDVSTDYLLGLED